MKHFVTIKERVNMIVGLLGKMIKPFTEIPDFYKGLFVVLLTWGNLFLYLWPHIFFWGDEGIYAGWIGVWGDWAAHNSYASRFAYQDISDWISTHPLFINTKFTYPFLANFISGMFLRAGVDRVNAFIIPTIITSLVFLWAIYKFYFIQLKTYKRAVLAVFIFLTSGGLGFWWFFQDLIEDPIGTLKFPPDQYTQLQEGTVYWLNTITGQLVPQRALLLGMVIGLVTINLISFLLSKKKVNIRLYMYTIGAGLLTSLLVLAHMHSFMVVFLLSVITLVLNLNKWKLLLVYAISTGIPAVVFYSLLYGGAIETGFFQWYPGWLANPQSKDMNFINFWFINWGIFIPLAIAGLFYKDLLKNRFSLTGIIIFIICNLFLLQPFDWDNSKLLTWSYLFLTIPVVEVLAYIWNNKNLLMKFTLPVFVFFLSFSGLLDIYRLTKTEELKLLMFSQEDIAIAEEFKEVSNPDSVVLTSDKHNHWVTTLTGRQILLGYRGWMWTYGINDREVYADILEMFAGTENTPKLLEKYDISYVVIGPSERFDYEAKDHYFRINYPLIISTANYNVYKVNNKNF